MTKRSVGRAHRADDKRKPDLGDNAAYTVQHSFAAASRLFSVFNDRRKIGAGKRAF